MSYYLKQKIDFERHNEDVTKLAAACRKREQERVPVSIGGSIRNLLSNPDVNDTGYSFQDFFMSVDAQIDCQLAFQHYSRHNILCDRQMGPPRDGWRLSVDFQNSYDQAWFGCPFRFFDDTDVPDTCEILKEDPNILYDWEDPDPFLGRGDFMKRALEFYGRMKEMCDSGYEFHGLPVLPPTALPATGTDGLFTLAAKLRGTVELMVDMYENAKYYHDLMDYLTRNIIARITTLREWSWDNNPGDKGDRNHKGAYFYADDSIAMLSPNQFKEFVLPYQRRLYDAFSDGSGGGIHLCGDATHHFKLLADTFNVKSFDTGFPVDHGALRRELGPDIGISGGPTIMVIKDGPPEAIVAETKRICESGVMEGRKFTLIAANNLAPCTPIENIVTFYEAGKRFGKYPA